MEAAKHNLPEKKFRAGAISATVWKNQAVSKTGENVSYYSISVERSYKDKSDQWQSTTSYRTNDIPKVVLVLNKAYEFLNLKDVPVEGTTESFTDQPIPNEDIVM